MKITGSILGKFAKRRGYDSEHWSPQTRSTSLLRECCEYYSICHCLINRHAMLNEKVHTR